MKWEPIETARSDCRDVLVWADGYLRPIIAWCEQGTGNWVVNGTSHRLPQPTHWMDIPSPPKGEA